MTKYICQQCGGDVINENSMFKCADDSCDHGEHYESELVGNPHWVKVKPEVKTLIAALVTQALDGMNSDDVEEYLLGKKEIYAIREE